MGNLAQDTAVTSVAGADGQFTAVLREDWSIWGPNGGYLAAVALRAAGAYVGDRLPRPASLLCHYLGVAAFDEVQLTVTTLRAARRAESVRVSMTQGGQPILEALVWAVADSLEGLRHDAAVMPTVGPPSDYPSLDDVASSDRPVHKFWVNIEQRPLLYFEDWESRPAGEPEFQAWMRFRPGETFPDDPYADAARMTVLVDTFQWPAAARGHAEDALGFVAPSLDLECQFHRPAPDEPWLFVDAHSPVAEDGLVAGSATVWDSAGHLLASGSQAMLCRPIRPGDRPAKPPTD